METDTTGMMMGTYEDDNVSPDEPPPQRMDVETVIDQESLPANGTGFDFDFSSGDVPPPLPLQAGTIDEPKLPPHDNEDSVFEPDTIFDAGPSSAPRQPLRELEISPENISYIPAIGDVINERFEIQSLIAVGELGIVYRVDDLRLKEKKALKLMHPALIAKPGAAEQFIQELKLLQRLSHERIVRVYDFGRTDYGDLAFFTMEFVEGTTLAAILKKKGGKLPLEKSLPLVHQLLDTLAYAHQHGTFRDLTPVNIMVRPSGKIVLLNFGLTKTAMKNAGSRRDSLGSIHYRAPEQRSDRSIATPQADLYAVGALLCQLITGEVPTENRSLGRGIPRRLEKVIVCLLDPDPEKRYSTAGEVKSALLKATMVPTQQIVLTVLLVALSAGLGLWYLFAG